MASFLESLTDPILNPIRNPTNNDPRFGTAMQSLGQARQLAPESPAVGFLSGFLGQRVAGQQAGIQTDKREKLKAFSLQAQQILGDPNLARSEKIDTLAALGIKAMEATGNDQAFGAAILKASQDLMAMDFQEAKLGAQGDPFNPEDTATTIMDPTSNMRLGDLPTKDNQRGRTEKILVKKRKEAIEKGDVVGLMQASAGGDKPEEKFRTTMEKAATVVGQIDSLQQLFQNDASLSTKFDVSLEPIENIWRSINPFDTKAKGIQAQITSIIPNLARGIFGEVGVLTDNDIRLYSKTIPNLGSTAAVRKLVLGITMRAIRDGIKGKIKIAAGSGIDVSGLTNVYSQLDSRMSGMLKESGLAEDEKGNLVEIVPSQNENVDQDIINSIADQL